MDRLISILRANDLILSILPYDWEFLDGRDAKRKYKTNVKNALLHALLITPVI